MIIYKERTSFREFLSLVTFTIFYVQKPVTSIKLQKFRLYMMTVYDILILDIMSPKIKLFSWFSMIFNNYTKLGSLFLKHI